jgi:hypothetical protein
MSAGTFYPTLAAYTTGVIRARHAYRADRHVEDGVCAVCGRRKRDATNSRRCWTCSHDGRNEVTA